MKSDSSATRNVLEERSRAIMTIAAIKKPWQEEIWRLWTNNAHEAWLLTTTLRHCVFDAVPTLASFCP